MTDLMVVIETLNFTLLGGILPALIWLWFWLREDSEHPEPKLLLTKVFFCGALGVLIAYFTEKTLYNFLLNFGFLNFGPETIFWSNKIVLGVFIAPLVEELIKFVMVYLLVFKNKAFDEPIDAMIYLITSALGFAALENVFFLFDAIYPNQELGTFFLTGNLRFLGATLLHVVASASLGGFVALAFFKSRGTKILYLSIGLITAMFLHGYFNWFIISGEGKNILKLFGLLWISTVLIILLFEKVKTLVWQPK